eukprot:m.42123 g.42123  ORF g.42123 m.42123 type:complete len:500 (-) comp6227_c0_seq1:165-1664(-)
MNHAGRLARLPFRSVHASVATRYPQLRSPSRTAGDNHATPHYRLGTGLTLSHRHVTSSGVQQVGSKDTPTTKPVTPDFNVPVNVADIKASEPIRRRAPRSGAWEGLDGLKDRTRGSLIESTLAAMESDTEFQVTAKRLRTEGAKKMSLDERKRRRRALDGLGVPSFAEFVAEHGVAKDLVRVKPEILQLNIGIHCNQACSHCHVESSPKRKETMSQEVADRCVALLQGSPDTHTLDLTGGAPELQAVFRPIVEQVRAGGFTGDIIDRCNLTVLTEPDQSDLVDFLATHRVRVVASLPCYSAKNVNMQRGKGVFDKSIEGLRQLNSVGYGEPGSGLILDLVYNPVGPHLAPEQQALEAKYKQELDDTFGVVFNSLFTITNMPIKRFADFLHRRGELSDYMDLLVRNFNPGAVKGLMCRNTISVSYDGTVYDCDFNQQLLLGAGTYAPEGGPEPGALYAPLGLHVNDLERLADLTETPIVVDSHCFGCTAGMGSSCQGATA